MTFKSWLVAFLFGAVIVVSMGLGALLATSIGGGDVGPGTTAALPGATETPRRLPRRRLQPGRPWCSRRPRRRPAAPPR